MSSKTKCKIVEITPGESIYRPGMASDCMYIIHQGQVAIFNSCSDLQKSPIAVLNSGEFLGEISALLEKPRSTLAVALTPTILHQIPRDSIKSSLESTPKWTVKLLLSTAGRLSKSNSMLKKHGLHDSNVENKIKNIKANTTNPRCA